MLLEFEFFFKIMDKRSPKEMDYFLDNVENELEYVLKYETLRGSDYSYLDQAESNQ